MCAIAGVLGLPASEQTQTAMLATMRRRGPDGSGVYTHEDLCLLHTRLLIMDSAAGSQPMVLDWGNERYVISYSGELYNTQQLRLELESLGHSFYGSSDTEVLLHGYAQWGEDILEKCNGVFAFAILKENSGQVFLARDRIGVKPLFYMRHCGGLLFASEIKTIFAYPNVQAKLDGEGAAQIVYLGPGRKPGSGVFSGVEELEPGCCAVYQNGKLQVRRYWKLRDRVHTDDWKETVEHVRYLVTDAVRRQMEADVPVGVFLSGGLDSSLIASICAREREAKGARLDTFSVDYFQQEQYFRSGRFQPDLDTEYIRIMQQHLDTQQHWSVLTAEELLEAMADATIARDLPGMADVDTSLLCFCGQVRPYVKVALSGECADEIFGGYSWYRDPTVRDAEGFPWAQNTNLRISCAAPWIRESIHGEDFVYSCYHDTLASADILPENSLQEKRMKQMVNLNFRWFMQTLLDRNDRMSMYQGLEVRVPFCDYRIAEYLYSVPWEMKDYRGREKGLLRYAMADFLPQCVLERKKSPYPKTHHPKYLQMAQTLLHKVMEDPNAAIYQLIDREALLSLLETDYPWPWYGQLMTRPQTIVHMLQIHFWLEHYSVIITH